MALRGKKPEEIEKRLKCLFYGPAGAGKTTAALNFPNAYLIDTEEGAIHDSYIELLNKNNSVSFHTTSFEDVLQEIKSLLTEKHIFKTVIIDPLTHIYDSLLTESADYCKRISKEKDATGTEFGRHYSDANKKMKQLLLLLTRLDMNVIITAHAKNEYGGSMAVIGQTFDCYKKLDYLFDLVFEIRKLGDSRMAVVKKSRIKTLTDGLTFPFTYDYIADKYGRSILEKETISEVLCSSDQLLELKRLINLLVISEDITDKWLEKAKVTNFEELSEKQAKILIDLLLNKIKGEKNED